MSTIFESFSPNLLTDKMEESIAFYEKVMGFEKIKFVPEEGVPVWVMLERDGQSIMLQSRESMSEEIPGFTDMKNGGSLLFYYKITEIDAFYLKCKEAGVEIVKEPYTTFYQAKEFVLREPNGFLIVFAEDVQ